MDVVKIVSSELYYQFKCINVERGNQYMENGSRGTGK